MFMESSSLFKGVEFVSEEGTTPHLVFRMNYERGFKLGEGFKLSMEIRHGMDSKILVELTSLENLSRSTNYFRGVDFR